MKPMTISLFILVMFVVGFADSLAVPRFFDPYDEFPFLESESSASSIVVAPLVGADALADIAVADISNGTVDIWMYAPPVFYKIQSILSPHQPRFIVSADFNGDGKPALVTSSNQGDNVCLYVQENDYAFTYYDSYISGLGPWAISTADITGDGLPDLIVANGHESYISVFSSPLADQGFNQWRHFECGYGPGTVVPGDFDNDGDIEVIALRENFGLMVYMEKDGEGNLEMAASYVIGSEDTEIKSGISAELNGDEFPDLILAINRISEEEPDYIRVLINNGFGVLEPAATYNTHELPVLALAEDFTDDQIVDLVVPCYGDGGFDVFIGEGGGDFIHHSYVEAGPQARDIAAFNLAGDDDLDIAVATRDEGRVYLFENHFDLLTAGPDTPVEAFNAALSIAPNPFNPRAKISFQLESAGDMTLAVFDASGRRVRVLHDGVARAGSGFILWDGTDDAGLPQASGVYSVMLQAGGNVSTTKAVLLK